MKIIYAAKWLKKLFGVGSVKKSDVEQAAELGYVLRYEDTAEFNITSIIASKLSNMVCSDVSAEIIPPGNQDNIHGNILKNDKMPDFLEESFRRCLDQLHLIAARAFGIGGVVLKPYIYNKTIYTDIIPQNRFFIIEQHGEVITKAVFIAETVTQNHSDKTGKLSKLNKDEKKTRFTRLEYHTLENGVYSIENKIIACDSDDMRVYKNDGHEQEGREVPIADSPFADKPALVKITGVKQMLFGFVKCPVDNKRDFSSIYGVPVTYGQEKLMKLITDLLNEIPDEYRNKKAFIGADDILFDRNDKLPKDGLYRLFRTMGSVDSAPFWEIFSPEIRHTSYFAGLDYLFGLLEKSICVNQGMLTDLKVSNATATAIKRSTLDTFSTLYIMRRNLEKACNELIYAFCVIAEAFDLCGGIYSGEDYRVQFDWDYRLLEDTSETWQQMLDAYNAGAAELYELRMYVFGEDRKTARAAISKNISSKDTEVKISDEKIDKILKDELIKDEIKEDEKIQEVQKLHEVLYNGEMCASTIFAPSGNFDDSLNPFRREAWNMAEQAKIYRDNPEIAKYLMREARF